MFEDNNPSNTNKSRSTGALALMPVGQDQDDYYFMSLITGKRLTRKQWDILPIPQGAINRVNEMAEAEGQPDIKGIGPVFEWEPGVPIVFADESDPYLDVIDENNEEINDNPMPDQPDDEFDPMDPNNNNEVDVIVDQTPLQADDDLIDPQVVEEAPVIAHDLPPIIDANQGAQADVPAPIKNEDVPAPTINEHVEETEIHVEDVTEEEEPPAHQRDRTNERYNLRSAPAASAKAREGGYQFLHVQNLSEQQDQETLQAAQKEITNFMFAQFTADRGIKKFGKLAVDALMKEFCQLEDLKVFKPVFAHKLTYQERTKALRSINLVEQKRCGRIKGRSVADGRKMRTWYEKGATASPTVTNEALKISLAIDALEKRKVAIADVPGAFLQADMDDIVHMKVTG